MAMALDAQSSGSGTGTSLTIAHTCTGSERALTVGAMNPNTSNLITGATYNGVAMTETFTDGSAALWMHAFQLAAPAAGTNNIVISASASASMAAFGTSFTGVDQTTPVSANAHATANPQASPRSDNITVQSGGFAVDWMIDFTATDTVTPGAGQTGLTGSPINFNSETHVGSYKQDATAMSQSWASGNRAMTHGVVALKPSAGASFDPALMAAMDRPRQDIVFSKPQVVASGMTPPDLITN